MLVTLIIGPERIRRTYQKAPDISFLNFPAVVNSILPDNFSALFTSPGNYLLPLLLFALFLGYHLHFDKEIAEPTYNILDSLSRIFYRINKYLINFEAIIIIPLIAVFVRTLKKLDNSEYYVRLFLVMTVATIIILFGFFPLIIFLFSKGTKKPYKTLFGLLIPMIAALGSGDIFFTTVYSMRASKENFDIPRKIGAFNLSIYSLLSRGGTALISASCMLFILKSHSELELTFFQIFWVTAFSFLISFLSFQTPSMGFYLTISTMCAFYGRGLEKGFETLIPLLPFLSRLSVLIDTTEGQIINTIVARREDQSEDVPVSDFF